MKEKAKLPWHLLMTVTGLLVMTFSLGGCTQGPVNIEANQDSADAYTIAYGNMVKLDAAAKYKQQSVLYDVSNIQMMYGEYEKALETVNLALEFSDDMMLVTNKIKLLEMFSAYEERDALVQQVVAEKWDQYPLMTLDDQLYFNFLLISNYDNETAIENYLEILENGVEEEYYDDIYNNLGWAYLNLYDYENAMLYCLKSLEYEPDDSITLSNLGNSYYGLDDLANAFSTYEKSMQSDPYNTYAVYGYALTAQALEKYDVAIDTWNQYVSVLPMDVDGWSGLYECYLAVEDLEGQSECLDALITLAPDDRGYAYDKLIVQQELGILLDPYEAISDYQISMGDFEAEWLVADFTYNYGSPDQGLPLYEALLTGDPLTYWDYSSLAEDAHYYEENELLERILVEVETNLSREERLEIEAYLYYYDENADKLFEVSSEIIAINPESGYGYEFLGDAFYFAKDFESAAVTYGLAATYSEDPYYSSQAQVDCLILLDRVEEANQLNEQLLASYPDDAYSYVYQARIDMKMGLEADAIENLVIALSLSDYLDDIFETYSELAPLKGHPSLEAIGQ